MDEYPRQNSLLSRFLVVFFVVFSFSLPTLARADQQSWQPPEVEALLQEVRDHRRSPLAIAPLIDLSTTMLWLTGPQSLDVLQKAGALVQDPLAVAWLQYMEQQTLHALGRYEEAQRIETSLGFADHWLLAGPFRNDGMAGFDAAYAPETEGFQGMDQSFDGKFADLRWMQTVRNDESGYLDVAARVADSNSAVVYGVTECYFEQSQVEAQLAVDGAYKLWVNGSPVAQNDSNQGGVFLRDFAPVNAKRGWNQIAMKLATDRVDGGWHVRFVDRRGQAIVRECRTAQAPHSPLDAVEDFPKSESIHERFQRDEQRQNWSAEQRVDAAYIVHVLQRDDASEPWLHFLDSVQRPELSTPQLIRAAKIEDQHWKAMDDVRLSQSRPDLSIDDALWGLGQRAKEVGFHARLDLTDGIRRLQALADDPRVALVRLGNIAGTLVDDVAIPEFEALLARYGERPALCSAYLRAMQSRYVETEALVACAQRSLESLDAVKSYLTTLGVSGRVELAQTTLEDLRPHFEHRPEWQRLVQLVAGFDAQWAPVLESLDTEIEMRPNDADLYYRRADILIRLGRDAEAVEALNHAVDLRPQLRRARQLLAALEAQEDKFYTPWRIGIEELQELRESLDLDQYDLGRVVDQRVVNVFPSGLATVYVQRAFMAETRQGADQVRRFQIGFSPNSEVVEIVAVRILRPDGTVRETFETRDVAPYSGPSAIYYDVRTRIVSLPGLEAGDLVSLEYTVSDVAYQNLFDDYFGDVWFIDSHYPSALARYVLYAPEQREIFAEVSGSVAEMETQKEGENLVRVWEERDLKAIERERASPGSAEVFRYLHLSTYSDPNAMADWYWNLVKEQLVTSPQMIAKVTELIDGVENRREQVAHIYEYVVRNTRYVGLEFGIHGFKPYRTTECFDRKFGDCKDTASLLKVMLEIANIDTHLVLIRTRDLGKMHNRYPSLAIYNHAIVYVPEFDLYLDGTAGFSGSQEMPDMDQGSTALHILDGKGGQPVLTPYLSAELHVAEWSATVDAREETPVAQIHARFIGGSAPSMRQAFEAMDQQREAIERWAARLVPSIQVKKVEFKGLSDIEEPVEFLAQTEGGRWFTRRGDEAVLLPFGRSAFTLSEHAGASQRSLALDLGPPSIEQLRFEIQLEEHFEPKNVEPTRIELHEEGIGRFVFELQWDPETRILRSAGTLRWEATQIATEDYPRFRAWARSVEREANSPYIFGVNE